MSPVDLEQDTDYSFELIVTETIAGEDYCSDRDTITVTIEKNNCPIADAGKDRRIPKFENKRAQMILDKKDKFFDLLTNYNTEIFIR